MAPVRPRPSKVLPTIRAPVVPSLMSTLSPPTSGPMTLFRICALSLRSARLRRSRRTPLAHAPPVVPRVVDPGVLEDAVLAGVAEVDALHVQVVHGHPVDDHAVGGVGHDPLLAAGEGDAPDRPVRGAVEMQPVAAAGGQHRARGAGQGDPGRGGARGRGLEVPGVRAVREVDRVAGPGVGERRLQLGGGRDLDGRRRGGSGDEGDGEKGGEQGEEQRSGAHGMPSVRGARGFLYVHDGRDAERDAVPRR